MFFRRKEEPALQAYGKLELAKDYLRVGCSAGGGQVLRDWLDRGFSGGDAGARVELAWPARFLWGAGSPLVGKAFPSSDTGGLRRFPFAVLVERKRRPLVEDLDDGLPLTGALWEVLDGHYRAHANFSDGQGYLRALRGLVVELGELEPREPEPVPLAAWLETLWPERGDAGLRELLAQVARLARDEYEGPVRLPLAPGLPYRDQVLAWRSALGELGLVDLDEVPTLFFPQEPRGEPEESAEPPFLAVLPDRVRPEHAAWLASPRTAPTGAAGDLVGPERRALESPAVAQESTPPLAASIRGILATIAG